MRTTKKPVNQLSTSNDFSILTDYYMKEKHLLIINYKTEGTDLNAGWDADGFKRDLKILLQTYLSGPTIKVSNITFEFGGKQS